MVPSWKDLGQRSVRQVSTGYAAHIMLSGEQTTNAAGRGASVLTIRAVKGATMMNPPTVQQALSGASATGRSEPIVLFIVPIWNRQLIEEVNSLA